MITKPNKIDTPTYYHYYIDLVQQTDLIHALTESRDELLELIKTISSDLENHAYAPSKWTIKELLRHIVDTERIFQYRAFRFSRFDSTELAGFDENIYIANNKDLTYTLSDLADEFLHLRNSSISLFKGFTDDMLDFKGVANKTQVTARGIGFMIVGHQLHHVKVLEERYFF